MYKVLIVADTDLDGTGSAVLITKFYEMFYSSKIPFKKGHQIDVQFPDRRDLDVVFHEDSCKKMVEYYDHIYLCDTAPNDLGACKNIGTILAPKMTIFDHHSTNLDRLQPYAKNFTDRNGGGLHIIEGERCSAKIAFDTLKGTLYREPAAQYNVYKKFAGLVNDLDLWYRKFPRSTELADYVAVVGAEAAYPVLLQVADNPDKSVGDMEKVINSVNKAKRQSLGLAHATLVKHKGYKSPFYTCLVDDWASWVGSEVVAATGLVAMFDIRRKSLSFRVGARYTGTAWHKAKGKKPNALDFAELLGGGGHPQAAGVSTGEASPIFKQLSERLGEILLETYNERSRSTAKRRVRRANTGGRKPRAKRS